MKEKEKSPESSCFLYPKIYSETDGFHVMQLVYEARFSLLLYIQEEKLCNI